MQQIYQKTFEDTMCYGDVPILNYKINYPCFTTAYCPSSAQNINEFYCYMAKSNVNYCRTVLYPQALEIARDFQDRPFNTYTFDVNFTVTYNSGCITSLYSDTYTYTGGAHGNTLRKSNTWNFRTGTLLLLNDVYPLTPHSMLSLLKCIEQQIEERLKADPGIYFDDYTFLLSNSFHTANFYLQPCNGVIYFQQYDIAPYSTGLPEFCFQTALL